MSLVFGAEGFEKIAMGAEAVFAGDGVPKNREFEGVQR